MNYQTVSGISKSSKPLITMPKPPIKGFSKLTKLEKIDFLVENYFENTETARVMFKKQLMNFQKIL